MTTEELKTFLYSLLSNWEDVVVEFKRGGKGFSTGEIGESYWTKVSRIRQLLGA